MVSQRSVFWSAAADAVLGIYGLAIWAILCISVLVTEVRKGGRIQTDRFFNQSGWDSKTYVYLLGWQYSTIASGVVSLFPSGVLESQLTDDTRMLPLSKSLLTHVSLNSCPMSNGLSMAEETKNPSRNVPKAMTGSMILVSNVHHSILSSRNLTL